jgi:hypothetical protein
LIRTWYPPSHERLALGWTGDRARLLLDCGENLSVHPGYGALGLMHVNLHIDWVQFLQYLYSNRLAIEGAVLFVVTSGIKTAPIPASRIGLWMYDWGHQLFNITNTRLTTTPVVTPPESPAASPKA